jgi:hypothetical protein
VHAGIFQVIVCAVCVVVKRGSELEQRSRFQVLTAASMKMAVYRAP